VPILASEQRLLDEAGGDGEVADDEEKKEEKKVEVGGRLKVLADGTYATETAYSSTTAVRLEAVKTAAKPPLRSEFFYFPFVYSGLARGLMVWFSCSAASGRGLLHRHGARFDADEARTAIRSGDSGPCGCERAARRGAPTFVFCSLWCWSWSQAMLIMTSVIRVGQSKFVTVQIDEDSTERILNCIQTLSELEQHPAAQEIFLEDTKAAYLKMLGAQEVRGIWISLLMIRMADLHGRGVEALPKYHPTQINTLP